MVYIPIESVNKLTVFLTTNEELDFKIEYWFRTCSFATNLVTSLVFNSIESATTMCHFGSIPNGSIANHFIFSKSTATSRATGDYVAVPEHFGQNEEPDSRKRGTNCDQA